MDRRCGLSLHIALSSCMQTGVPSSEENPTLFIPMGNPSRSSPFSPALRSLTQSTPPSCPFTPYSIGASSFIDLINTSHVLLEIE